MTEKKLERECDAPAGWETNTILQRNAAGKVVEIKVPDDDIDPEGVSEDAGDD